MRFVHLPPGADRNRAFERETVREHAEPASEGALILVSRS
jgi:hypothetical protein